MDKIFKQSFYLFSAQVFTKIIGFFYTLYIAKSLAVSDFGLYSLSLSYFSIIGTISEFGLNRYLIREVAKGEQNLSHLILNVAFLRLTITILITVVIGSIIFILDTDNFRNTIILFAFLAAIPQSISLTIDAFFVGLQKIQLSSIALCLMSLLTAICGFILLQMGFGVSGVLYALIFGQLVYFLFLVLLLWQRKLLHIRSGTMINWGAVKQVLTASLPYGVLAVLGLLYFRLDILLLGYLKGNLEVGFYGAAYRFLDMVIFIPSALSAALFPAFAKLEDNHQEIRKIYFKSIKIMGLFGLIICFSYILLIPQIFGLFLPNYSSSIEIIKILSLAIPFMFIHIPGVQALLSTDKFLKPVIVLSLVTLSFNIILNLLFIPFFGSLAAAWITVLSEILSFVLFYVLLRIKIL